MVRKTNKQLLKEKKAYFLTVAQLIEQLKKFPKDAFVGNVGHFGEFYGLSKSDIHKYNAYITPTNSWRDDNREYLDVVEITTSDIGPDPD